jgi:natural product precursor
MRTISKLKLDQLSKTDLEERKMNVLKGGAACMCGCTGSLSDIGFNASSDAYGGIGGYGDACTCACQGSSSSSSNSGSNKSFGYSGSGGNGNCSCACNAGNEPAENWVVVQDAGRG